MMKLDAITLDFARQVIEEETGTPLEIGTTATLGVPRRRAKSGSWPATTRKIR